MKIKDALTCAQYKIDGMEGLCDDYLAGYVRAVKDIAELTGQDPELYGNSNF